MIGIILPKSHWRTIAAVTKMMAQLEQGVRDIAIKDGVDDVEDRVRLAMQTYLAYARENSDANGAKAYWLGGLNREPPVNGGPVVT